MPADVAAESGRGGRRELRTRDARDYLDVEICATGVGLDNWQMRKRAVEKIGKPLDRGVQTDVESSESEPVLAMLCVRR